MKKITLFFALVVSLTMGCEEIPPVINPSMGGNNPDDPPTSVEEQKKQVLIEEFTGVRCVNCPAGSEAIEALLSTHGEQLVAISIHAGSFSAPYQESAEVFRIDDGINILNYVGEPLGYPTAVIDRKLFDGEFDLQLGRNQWAGFVALQLIEAPKVKLEIQKSFDALTRNVAVVVKAYVEETITGQDIRLSLALTESNIVDLQLTPASSTPDANYKHKHVLRDMISNYDGDPITDPFTEGAVITRNYNFTLSEDFVESNCKLIAYVHLNGENKEVLQAHETRVLD